MRINEPKQRDEIIIAMMLKHPGWVFKVWMIWFMQKDDCKIGGTEIGKRLGGMSKQAVGNALKILRKTGDLEYTNLTNGVHSPVYQNETEYTQDCTKVHSGVILTKNQEEETKKKQKSSSLSSVVEGGETTIEKCTFILAKLSGNDFAESLAKSCIERLKSGKKLSYKQLGIIKSLYVQASKPSSDGPSVFVSRPKIDKASIPGLIIPNIIESTNDPLAFLKAGVQNEKTTT